MCDSLIFLEGVCVDLFLLFNLV